MPQYQKIYIGIMVNIVISAYFIEDNIVDSANWGIKTARRIHAVYTIGLSINKDPKLKKRKRKDKQ